MRVSTWSTCVLAQSARPCRASVERLRSLRVAEPRLPWVLQIAGGEPRRARTMAPVGSARHA